MPKKKIEVDIEETISNSSDGTDGDTEGQIVSEMPEGSKSHAEDIVESKIDPHNPPENVIVIEAQPDGNWKGFMRKYGKIIEERHMEPHMVIDYLLHHP